MAGFTPPGLRVNPAINNQFFQCNPRDFPANWVKRGDCNGLRRVIDDEVDASDGFKGTDITALAANNPAFHLVIGQGNPD